MLLHKNISQTEKYVSQRRTLKKDNGDSTIATVIADIMNLVLCLILLRMSTMQEAQGKQDFPSATSAITYVSPKEIPTQSVVIGYNNNKYYVDLVEVSKEQLVAKLIEQTKGAYETAFIIISAPRNADYGGIADALSMCRTAGFKQVALK